MASLLEGRIKKLVAQKFHGRLNKGKIRRGTKSLNEYGDPEVTDAQLYNFEGVRDSFTDQETAAGIPLTDIAVLVILGSCSVRPLATDYLYIFGKWHAVRRILSVDPADATMRLQCYEAELPT